ncbi:hypothetical protein FIBSPDRAFT_960501 [Athelia psychrophila]|uniref:TRP C-terminal domain-containing protein n=1 Tax=Athelia psychrophila TaxID=1759441 RepID=A0A166CA68_9AGAM|nr:hypothetical protein FIBSPDRAFT_960501 [Fibularhizoctonia sp. CBS 109695]
MDYVDCFSSSHGNLSEKLQVSTVYAQIVDDSYLNITIIGYSNVPIVGRSNDSTKLATLFTSIQTLTLTAWTNSSYLCSPLRPPSPLPIINATEDMYCPIAAGPFAFSTSIPWSSSHVLTTQSTEIHAVDPDGNDMLCINIDTTPLGPRSLDSAYGQAAYIFWGTVALAAGYWLVVGIARLVSAWGRGSSRPGPGFWSKVESGGFILASALSGERLATSPALMRFCSPSMRDIIFHTQWCAALAMVAVQWPAFIYPILTQTAWATLSYNVSLTQGANAEFEHWDPLRTAPYSPPGNFADQLADITSPLYIDPTLPNKLFTLPSGTTPGMASFAWTVGLRPQDLFAICVGLFLAICAGIVVLSFIVWLIDWVALLMSGSDSTLPGPKLGAGTRSPAFGIGGGSSKDALDGQEESRSLSGHLAFRPRGPNVKRRWWRSRPDFGSFHGSTLAGNLTRALVLFHFPVTIFSCYQFTVGRSEATMLSVVLAALTFVFICILLPSLLVVRLTRTTTNKLYDETRTLLSLGPLYNHYRHGSQLFASLLFATNLAFGITIGCGQKSGTAQAIIILIIEVVSALVTSVWLPWGQGASMGLISFLFCVARIVIAVLLVILTPTISIGTGAGGWVAYGILIVLALIYLSFALMLVVKLLEAVVRIVGSVGFDRSKHVIDSGLVGACGLLGCCGGRRKKPRSTRRRYRATEVPADAVSEVSSYLPPAGVGKGSTASHHSHSPHSQPASVLRPEHALRPYREDSDDENGYIMGAWQPFPRPGYNSVEEPSPTASAPTTQSASGTSGFSRVGGGRATFDTPYAIATGSTLTFPSARAASVGPASALAAPSFHDDDEWPAPTASVANIARQPQHAHSDLPPGAMPPHTRTKSQTAIVERYTPVQLPAEPSAEEPRRASMDDGDDDASQPKKKHWFNIRKNRRHSDGDALARDGDVPAAITPTPGKSTFVVLRDKTPQSAGNRAEFGQQPAGSTSGSDGSGLRTPMEMPPSSFKVLR